MEAKIKDLMERVSSIDISEEIKPGKTPWLLAVVLSIFFRAAGDCLAGFPTLGIRCYYNWGSIPLRYEPCVLSWDT
ncbi:hypothetical protein DRO57_06130 [Candidatus Bathyarchaeota archaeon]|nr:MAG: hypothetical protein DRO57_06130 [Candidatus Bathyarchaeota archaeon]